MCTCRCPSTDCNRSGRLSAARVHKRDLAGFAGTLHAQQMPGRGVAAGTSGNALSRTCAPSRTRMGLAPAPLAADVSGRVPRRKPERRRARPGGRRGTSVGADAVNGVLTLVSLGQTMPAFVKQRARVRAAATLASDDEQARRPRLLLLDKGSPLRCQDDAHGSPGGPTRDHWVLPAIRATTHVEGKAIRSSRRPRRRAGVRQPPWIRAVSASLLPFHRCRSVTGFDRAPADASLSSVGSVSDGLAQSVLSACQRSTSATAASSRSAEATR